MDFSELPLRDIHLPEVPGWWPPAAGWWLLVAAALLMLVALAFIYHRRRRQRAALSAVQALIARLNRGDEPVECLQQLSIVLRRYAMSDGAGPTAGAATVAGLTGRQWLEFLDSRWDRAAFVHEAGSSLVAAPYRPPRSVTTEQALALSLLCADWLRAQRPGR